MKFHQSYFERFDNLLDDISKWPKWLNEPDVAMIVQDAIHYRDNKLYSLFCYCIMPNHVHMLFEPYSKDLTQLAKPTAHCKNGRVGDSTYIVTKILESLKKYTALRANRILKRAGAFWQHESYDHVIRNDDEFENTLWYILFNPVKAGLIKDWKEWKWSYCKSEFLT